MKKFLPFFSYLFLLLPFFEMVKANEYKFLSGTSSGNTVSTLMAKLENLEKIAHRESKSDDLATIKLP